MSQVRPFLRLYEMRPLRPNSALARTYDLSVLLSAVVSGLGFFLCVLLILLRVLAHGRKKRSFDGHLYSQAHFLRKALDGLAKLRIILQIKSVNELLSCWVLRNLRSIVNVTMTICEPLKTDSQRFSQLRCDFSTRLAPALLITRNLSRCDATDLCQISLGPTVARARFDEPLGKFAVHLFKNSHEQY